MRTVASTELLVITPQTTSALWPAALSRDSRSVPIKALFVRLTMTGSQTSGAASILELVAGLAGPVCGTGFERVVAHVIYGQTQAAPGFEQPRNIALGIRIVARAIAGPACVVYRFLDVNYDKGRRLWNSHVLNGNVAGTLSWG